MNPSSDSAPQAVQRRRFIEIAFWVVVPLCLYGWCRLFLVRLIKSSDLPLHVTDLQATLEGYLPWPAHPGFFFLTAALGGFSRNGETLMTTGLLVVMMATLAKLLVCHRQGWKLFVNAPDRGIWCVAVAAVMFSFGIPNPLLKPWVLQYYLGNIVPNVWHNPTTMLLMPVAMLQFVFAFRWLQRPTPGTWIITLLLGVVGMVIKPSYMLAFVPAFPLVALWHFKQRPLFLQAVGMCVVLFVLIEVQRRLVFTEESDSHVAVGLFKVYGFWHQRTWSPALSMAAGIVIPLLFPILAARYRPALWGDLLFRFAALQHLAGLAVYLVLMETGERFLHGNFGWQVVVTSFILYWVTTIRLLDGVRSWRMPLREAWPVLIVGGLHFLSGVVYCLRALRLGLMC